jgi:hypothetical protein
LIPIRFSQIIYISDGVTVVEVVDEVVVTVAHYILQSQDW